MKGSATGKVVQWEKGESMDQIDETFGAWDYTQSIHIETASEIVSKVRKIPYQVVLSCENSNFTTFASLLLVSTLIGVYFGWKDRRNKDETNYALGGRRFSALPVAVSLTATSLSAITMMGSPSEYYFYGSTYAWTILADAISCVIAALFRGS